MVKLFTFKPKNKIKMSILRKIILVIYHLHIAFGHGKIRLDVPDCHRPVSVIATTNSMFVLCTNYGKLGIEGILNTMFEFYHGVLFGCFFGVFPIRSYHLVYCSHWNVFTCNNNIANKLNGTIFILRVVPGPMTFKYYLLKCYILIVNSNKQLVFLMRVIIYFPR